MLQLLNRKFNLGIGAEQLSAYALQLGSDCPFFLLNRPAYATGRGEVLEPVDLNMDAYHWLLVNPGIHISTAEAFASITPQLPVTDLRQIIGRGPENWKGSLINQFEAPAIERHPVIGEIRDCLYGHGAVYSSMTGSGSTVYGLFPRARKPEVSFPAEWFRQWIG